VSPFTTFYEAVDVPVSLLLYIDGACAATSGVVMVRDFAEV